MDPLVEYRTRRDERAATHATLSRRSDVISNARLGVFLLALTLGAAGFLVQWLSSWWAVVPLVGYVVLLVIHDRVIRLRDRASASVTFYERGLARLDGTWPGKGVVREDLVAEDHPYAADLDLFGEGSLFDLLCTARTAEGERTLADWLAASASPEEIALRREAVDELAPGLDLREELFLLGGTARAGVHPESLTRWSEAPAVFGNRRTALVVVAALLAVGAVGSVVAWIVADVGPIPLIAVALVEWIVNQVFGKKLKTVVSTVTQPGQELGLLASVLERIETEPLSSRKVVAIKSELGSDGKRASRAIRGLGRLVEWLDAPRNVLFAPIAYLLMWRLLFALAIESWRLRSGRRIGAWLAAVGEFEALCSLAGYRWERPEDTWPEIVGQGPVFEARGLGHPLLVEEDCVRNDVALGGETRAMIVSGSNMSGKSTLLRTVGLDVVLALAGAPVRATGMKLSVLEVGATIRIHDSLHGKTSRFMAEIKRLRQLRDLAGGEVPLLFLLDEVFHGTNSHDRLVGATALLGEFIDEGSIGLVVTHDLAIAEAAEDFEGRVLNVHFVDRIVDGKLEFDFKLKPGVVQRSNALDLMREVGLRV